MRSAARSSCAPTGSKARRTSASRPPARSSCARGARRCSPTGCSTTSSTTRSGPRATSRCARPRLDHAVPRSSSSATRETATSRRRASTSARPARTARRRRSGLPGPTCTRRRDAQLHDVRRAEQRLVSARRRDRSRQAAQGRHRAQRQGVLSRRAGASYTPWLEFPLSNERKSGFLTPIVGSYADPRLRNRHALLLQPRAQLRRDVHAAADDASAGCMIGGDRAVTCSSPPSGEIDRAKSCRTTASPTRYALGVFVEAQPAVRAVAHRLRQLQPRVGLDLFRRLLRPHRGDVAEDAAAGGRARSPTTGRSRASARVQSFQTLQDPNPAAASTPPYNMLPQVKATMADTDWLGLTWSGTARVHALRAVGARCPPAIAPSLYPSVRWIRQGSCVVRQRARRASQLWQYDLNQPRRACRRRQRERRGADHQRRRGAHLRARLDRLRHELHPDARAARDVHVHPVPAARTSCRCSTPCRTTSTSRSSSSRTASSAATASATRISSRSP